MDRLFAGCGTLVCATVRVVHDSTYNFPLHRYEYYHVLGAFTLQPAAAAAGLDQITVAGLDDEYYVRSPLAGTPIAIGGLSAGSVIPFTTAYPTFTVRDTYYDRPFISIYLTGTGAAGVTINDGFRVTPGATTVPEPGTLALAGLGVGVSAVRARRRRGAAAAGARVAPDAAAG